MALNILNGAQRFKKFAHGELVEPLEPATVVEHGGCAASSFLRDCFLVSKSHR
jgi:hypothetical protein